MRETDFCAVCKSNAKIQRKGGTESIFYVCPVCGRYELYALDGFVNKAGNQLHHICYIIVLEKKEL